MGFGGKGANQAVACAKLGRKSEQGLVSIIAKVGNDVFGDNTADNFRSLGLDASCLRRTSEASTGVAPICVDEQGRNSIVIVTGANDLLSEEEVIESTKVIASSSVLAAQLEIDPNVSLCALKIAREHGVMTVLTPAPAKADLSEEFFKFSDILCPNEGEAEVLSGRSVSTQEDAVQAARVLVDKGVKQVVITLGSRGCLVVDKESSHLLPAPKVEPVDTTGAGDCFVGSMLFFLARGKSLIDACTLATQVAAISVTAKGTQTSYPERSRISWIEKEDPEE
jgi:ribokinase